MHADYRDYVAVVGIGLAVAAAAAVGGVAATEHGFAVTIDSTTSPVTEGETMTVNATVENTGNESDERRVTLEIDGKQVDRQAVKLAGGESTTVELMWPTGDGDAGTHDATVSSRNDSDEAEVTVQPGASFTVRNLSTNSPVTEGESLDATATIENTGNESDDRGIRLEIDGEPVDSQVVTLGSGESKTVELEWETGPDDGGNYTAVVTSQDDSESRELRVTDDQDASVVVRRVVTVGGKGNEGTRPTPPGAIIRVDLGFENATVGTVTFGDRDAHNGDRDAHNIEINVTVRDTDGDGAGTLYLNTFQVGHGMLYNGEGGQEQKNTIAGDPYVASRGGFESRNHGFFTLPSDEGTALDGPEGNESLAHSDMDIKGGSQGGAVLPPGTYPLSVVTGDQPATAAGTLDDRTRITIDEPGNRTMHLWTAPGAGVNSLDPETASPVNTVYDETAIRSADGGIATSDYLIIQAQSRGLAGILHEWVLRRGANESALVDRDTRMKPVIVTDLWSSENLNRSAIVDLAIREHPDETPPNADRLRLEPTNGTIWGVEGDIDDDGHDDIIVGMALKMRTGGDIVATPDRELRAPTKLTVTGSGDMSDVAAGSWRYSGTGDNGTIRVRNAGAGVDRRAELYDNDTQRLEVPSESNVTIPGVTNVAAGTNLTVRIIPTSNGSELTPRTLATTVEYVPDGPNEWSVTDEFGNLAPNTTFEVRTRRQGAAGNIVPSGEHIDAVVIDAPSPDVPADAVAGSATEGLVDENQAEPGTTVHIEGRELDGTGGATIRIAPEADIDPGDAVRVSTVEELPEDAAAAEIPVQGVVRDEAGVIDVAVPDDVANAGGTVGYVVETTGDIDPSNDSRLVVTHWDGSDWTALETLENFSKNGSVRVDVTTDGFSLFAVFVVAEETPTTATDGPGATATGGTDADGPGLGAAVAVVTLVTALAARGAIRRLTA